MRFVADRGNKPKLRRILIQYDAVLPPGQEDLLLPLGETDNWNILHPKRGQDIHRAVQLSFAAVDDDEVGHRAEAVFLVLRPEALPQAALQRLRHRGKVIRALHRLDAEPAIFLLVRLAVDEHDHGRDRIRALRVGNVIALHPPNIADPQDLPELSGRSDAALKAADLALLLAL